MKIYNIRTGEGNGNEIKVTWLCDGDDDPAYPIGFCLDESKHKFGKFEREYLKEVLNRKKEDLAA